MTLLVEGTVASNYNVFTWSCSGFKDEAEAAAALADIEGWFKKTHDQSNWQTVSSVRQGPYGWKAELEGRFVKNDV